MPPSRPVAWAVIGGYGTKDQIGANAFFTNVRSQDYELRSGGALVGIYDRVELSFAQQKFDTREVGGLLGLGNGYKFTQKIYGVKVKVAGDAVLEQDSWLPQIAVGVLRKENDRGDLLRALGIKSDKGTDYYVSATKLFLAQSLKRHGHRVVVHDGAATPANSPALHEFEIIGDLAALKDRSDIKLAAVCCPWPQYRALKFPEGTTVLDCWGIVGT